MKGLFSIGAALIVVLSITHASAGVEAEIEASVVITSRNDTRIPGDGGTRLSFVHDLTTSAAPALSKTASMLQNKMVKRRPT